MKGDKITPVVAAKPQPRQPRKTTTARPEPKSVKIHGVKSKAVATVEPAPGTTASDAPAEATEAVGAIVATVVQAEEDVIMSKNQAKPEGSAVPPAGEPATQLYQGVTAFNRDYMESVMKAADTIAKGYESLGSEWMNYATASVEDGMKTSKALIGCGSVDEAVEIQSGYLTSALDKYLAESAKLSEMSIKLANEAIEPLNSGLVVAARERARSASGMGSESA